MSYQGGGAWRALGRGLKDVGHGVGRRRLEDEERERRDRLDEERRADIEYEREVQLAGMGGGEGPAPTRTKDLAGPGDPNRETFEPPPLLPEPDRTPAGASDFMPAPELETNAPSLEITESDPAYRNLAGGKYHMMDPEAQRQQQVESDFETQLDQGRRTRGAWAEDMGPVMGRVADARPGEVSPDDLGLLGAENMETPWFTPPGREYDPESDEVYQRGKRVRDENIEAGYGPMGGHPPAGRAGTTPGGPREADTRQQMAAQKLIDDLTRVDTAVIIDPASVGDPDQLRESIIANSPFTPEEARQIIRTGMLPDGTPVEEEPALPEPGPVGEPFSDYLFDGSLGGESTPRPEPSGEEGPAQPGPVRQEITQDQADYLREVQGLSDEDIRSRYIVR